MSLQIAKKSQTTQAARPQEAAPAAKPAEAKKTASASAKAQVATAKADAFKLMPSFVAKAAANVWAAKPASAESFAAGKATAVGAKPATAAADKPADLQSKVGTLDYYKARNDDFIKRNPGMTPPDYYLNYGGKYAERFSNELRPKLSPAGQAWLDKTRELLQQKIEDKRREDPKAFAQLERNPEAFKAFAYGTHPDAYLQGGLSKLPPSDLVKIAATPDLKDLFTKDGVKQVIETGIRMTGQWAQQAAGKIKGWLGF